MNIYQARENRAPRPFGRIFWPPARKIAQLRTHVRSAVTTLRITLIIPGQFGPTSRVLDWLLSTCRTSTMSHWGIPSVMATINLNSACTASSMASLAALVGTNNRDAFAWAFSLASAHDPKIGTPKHVSPCLLGFTPPTILVPYDWQSLECSWPFLYAI